MTRQITSNNFYDAEATVSPKKDKIVYTSDKSGDLELYVCDLDGKNEVQVTRELGYDGGAFSRRMARSLFLELQGLKQKKKSENIENCLPKDWYSQPIWRFLL
ncbi:MAG: hypothetical protein U0T81_01875 [Saprospiraceae bacterium]